MVGQAVRATGESPKDDRQSRVPRGTVPPEMPVATNRFLLAIIFENAYICQINNFLLKRLFTAEWPRELFYVSCL